MTPLLLVLVLAQNRQAPTPARALPQTSHPAQATAAESGDDRSLDPGALRLASARSSLARGEAGPALAALRRALSLAPGEPSVRLELGQLLIKLEKGEEALTVLAPLFTAWPDSAWLATEEARAQLAAQDRDAAEHSLRRALEVAPDSAGEARLLLVDLLLSADRLPEAAAVLKPLVERVPSLPSVSSRLAKLRAAAGRRTEAGQILDRVIRTGPREGASSEEIDNLRLQLADLWVAERRFDDAWGVLQPLRERRSEDVSDRDSSRELLLHVGSIARHCGRPVDALAWLGAALHADPLDARTLHELEELLEHAPDLRFDLVARRAEVSPGDPAAQLASLTMHVERAQWPAFFDLLEGLPGELRYDPRTLLLEGQALRRSGRTDEARVVLGGLTGGPSDGSVAARASFELGLIQYASEELKTAQASFARAAQGSEPALAAEAHFNRGVVLDRMGRFADAVEAYRSATAARPDYGDAWLQAGLDLRHRLGDSAAARKAFRRYLELGGDDPEVRRFVGGKP